MHVLGWEGRRKRKKDEDEGREEGSCICYIGY